MIAGQVKENLERIKETGKIPILAHILQQKLNKDNRHWHLVLELMTSIRSFMQHGLGPSHQEGEGSQRGQEA
jgi:hypothetical protein